MNMKESERDEKYKLPIPMEYLDLKEDEKIVAIVGRKIHSYLIPIFTRTFWLFLVLYIAYLIIVLNFPTVLPFVIISVSIILVFWGIVFVISLAISVPFVNGHRYILTNQRIILIRKFLGIMYREIEYKRMTDLILKQSLFGRIFNYGSLLPATAGVEVNFASFANMSIEGVEDPFTVRKIILRYVKNIQDKMREIALRKLGLDRKE